MNHVFVSFNLALSNLLLWNYGPVHTNPFSFENAYFCIRFRRSSTLMRWKTDTLSHENGGFRKRLQRGRRSKTDAVRVSVEGRKRRFSKTLTSPTENENVSFSHSQWTVENVDGRKQFENASVEGECIKAFHALEIILTENRVYVQNRTGCLATAITYTATSIYTNDLEYSSTFD